MYPSNRHYTKEHEWISVSGMTAKVGITDYAQEQLGDVVFVELPEVGQSFDQGAQFGSIESVKAVVEPESPLSGEVVARNEEAYAQPDLLNSSPYEAGWMFRVRMSDAGEYESLLSATDYAESL